MKILIIPDVHGRDFWIEPCSQPENYDKIVFLGDYHDPYSFQVSQALSFERLKNVLVPFVEKNRKKVICLFGNHDGNYLVGNMANRFDWARAEEVCRYLKKMKLQLVFEVDGFLFSHSGVLPQWLKSNNITLNDLKNMKFDNPALMDVSVYRGGLSCGSVVWGDVYEYIESKKLPGFYQIFGHTQLEDEPIITDEFACLDCRKAFVLDTKEKTLVAISNSLPYRRR